MSMLVACVPYLASFCLGLREYWKLQYVAPLLAKKIAGLGDFEEVRFRHPSPGNEVVNRGLGSKEIARHHYKQPYSVSRYNVRHPEVGQRSVPPTFKTHIYFPTLYQKLSPQDEFRFYAYREDDQAGNPVRKQKYDQLMKEAYDKYNDKEYENQINSLMGEDKDPYYLLETIHKNNMLKKYEDYQESTPGPGRVQDTKLNILPVITPDLIVHSDEGLRNYNSLDLQLLIELEHRLFEFADKIEKDGYPTYTGKTDTWHAVDASVDQENREMLGRVLKYKIPESQQV